MARIRSIKPEFWSSEQVVECSTNARLLFIGLWNFCDDLGRHTYSPKQIKALVYPSDDFTIDQIRDMLDELSRNGLIKRYVVDGKEYLYITGWEHQRIDRPQKPKFPAPPHDNSTNNQRALATDRNTERRGEERDNSPSLRSGESARAQKVSRETVKTSLPERWKPNAEDLTEAIARGFSQAEIDRLAAKFRVHYHARGETRVDWSAQWVSWLLDEKPLGAAKPAEPRPQTFFAEEGSERFRAWDAYQRGKNGRGIPCNDFKIEGRIWRGWYVEAEWPPGHAVAA